MTFKPKLKKFLVTAEDEFDSAIALAERTYAGDCDTARVVYVAAYAVARGQAERNAADAVFLAACAPARAEREVACVAAHDALREADTAAVRRRSVR